MEFSVKILIWFIKWSVVAVHLPVVVLRECKRWNDKRREKSIQQIESDFETAVEEEVSRISEPEILIANNIDQYVNTEERNPIILTSDNYRIRRIDNEEGARFFGKDRGWCTATPGENWYRNSYSKDRGSLFIIYKGRKKRPEAQLFVNKNGGLYLKLKFNANADWNDFIRTDSKLKDWWDIYYHSLVDQARDSIEIRSTIHSNLDAGITVNDLATLALLSGRGGYEPYGGGQGQERNGLFGQRGYYGGGYGGYGNGGLAAQAHADGSAIRSQIQAAGLSARSSIMQQENLATQQVAAMREAQHVQMERCRAESREGRDSLAQIFDRRAV